MGGRGGRVVGGGWVGGWGVVENSSLLFKRTNAHSLKCDRTHLATVKFMWRFWSNFFRKQEQNSFPNLASCAALPLTKRMFCFPFCLCAYLIFKRSFSKTKTDFKEIWLEVITVFFLHWGILAPSNDQRKVSNIISACFLICVSFNQEFSNIKSKKST